MCMVYSNNYPATHCKNTMACMPRDSRSRRAALSDLLLAYLVILVLAVFTYLYFASAVNPILNFQISQKSYQNEFVGRDLNFLKHINQWGDDNNIKHREEIGGFAVEVPMDELTNEQQNLLPVESYLGEYERPIVCDGCFKYRIQHVIENKVCTRETTDLLVLIFSSPENLHKRTAIRETWLSPYMNDTSRVRHLFLLGLSEMIGYDAKIQKENNVYHDILQGDFIEDYHNLTYKTLMGLKWSVLNCFTAHLIAKIDDDVWFNVETALEFLRFKPLPFAVGGKCIFGTKPMRNPASKWYASYQSYPEGQYPPFCVGPGYMTSVATASKIVAISNSVPYFHLEDVYIGMCLEQLSLQVKNLYGFFTVAPVGHTCRYRHHGIVLIHGIPPNAMRMLWNSPCQNIRAKMHPGLGMMRRSRVW